MTDNEIRQLVSEVMSQEVKGAAHELGRAIAWALHYAAWAPLNKVEHCNHFATNMTQHTGIYQQQEQPLRVALIRGIIEELETVREMCAKDEAMSSALKIDLPPTT